MDGQAEWGGSQHGAEGPNQDGRDEMRFLAIDQTSVVTHTNSTCVCLDGHDLFAPLLDVDGGQQMADMAWNIKCREEDMEFRRRELQWRKEEASE